MNPRRAALSLRALSLRAGLLCALLVCAWPAGVRPAGADPLPALRAVPGEAVAPGDPTWPLGPRQTPGGPRVDVQMAEGDAGTGPGGRFVVQISPSATATAAEPLRGCAGLSSFIRRNLHKTRAVEFRIRADRPVPGIMVVTSANTERPRARDRHYGAFVIGAGWKSLRLVYGTQTPLPGWPREAVRLGFEPGDLVLRPDSVEDICIGAEDGRLDGKPVRIEIEGLRFAP